MRVLSGFLCAVLILFAAVQFNDPDPFLWGSIYAVGALWTGIATVRPGHLARPIFIVSLGLSLCAGIAGLIRYWPQKTGWWRVEVWWETETAREGMGMMIVFAALLFCAVMAARQVRKA